MLSPLQERLVRLFFSLPDTADFALAGGSALVYRAVVDRSTRDLDFFVPIQGVVRSTSERFEARLVSEGFQFRVVRSAPSFVRLVVSQGQDEVVVDLGYDFRLHDPERTAIGNVLSLPDLAADKLLALFGRAEARDYLDVYHLAQRFSTDEMLSWAKAKDPGFDEYVLATMLGHIDRHDRREFEADEATFAALTDFFSELRATLIARSVGGK